MNLFFYGCPFKLALSYFEEILDFPVTQFALGICYLKVAS